VRQIVLDTETTGLEVADGHRVIEIGCIELVHRRPTGRDWHRYRKPGREVDRERSRSTASRMNSSPRSRSSRRWPGISSHSSTARSS
jgi:DNA polymerase III epsilon subunit-like protein